MCGIAAVIGPFETPCIREALQSMVKAQLHRGPDDEGAFLQQNGKFAVGLGSRRLAILDRSSLGHQPFVNPDTGDVLVYNGEIYNFQELRRSLQSSGYTFRSGGDTEVLLRAFEYWGIECLLRLDGMFAFALWNPARRRLFLARDHLGIKPLYYYGVPGNGFVCASEVRALVASGLVPRAVDRSALASYLAFGSVQEARTIMCGVSAVPPASWMEVEPGGSIVRQATYWEIPRPNPENSKIPIGELVENGRAVLKRSIQNHLLSDAPLGIFLSSGLDSTAVLGVAQQVASSVLHAITVSFPDHPEHDELAVATETAKRLEVVHHHCILESRQISEWVVQGLDGMDQPSFDGLNTYIVSRSARQAGLVVALSGQGGDEIFAGYQSFRKVPAWYAWAKWIGVLPKSLRVSLIRLVGRRMNTVARQKGIDIMRTDSDLKWLYFQFRRLLSNDQLLQLGLEYAPDAGQLGPAIEGDPVASIARFEASSYLRNTLLRDVDVFGMANSVEIRVPLLDRELVEWAFGLPGDVLLPAGALPKDLLRQMCSEIYTPEQQLLPKRGFALPWTSWLMGPLRELMEDSLSSLSRSGWVDPEGVADLRRLFLQEPQSAAWSRIWALVSLGHWLKRA